MITSSFLLQGKQPSPVRRFCGLALVVLWTALAAAWQVDSKAVGSADQQSALSPILGYIASGWDTLTRSMSDCHTVVDPKLNETSILYLPSHFPAPEAVRQTEQRCNIQVKELPV